MHPETQRKSGFINIWKKITATCQLPFKILSKRPQGDLSAAYNGMIAELCNGHAQVYELTTCAFSDSPTLERGTDGYVNGKDALATQTLVVLYLVRDFINAQVKTYKGIADDGSVSGYVQSFEKFTCAVNCLKSCFTYQNWVWLKWGIPLPHTIPPTELMASIIWIESIVHKIKQEKLRESVKVIVQKARCNCLIDQIDEMESIKRLSMILHFLPDAKYYAAIIEETYTSQLSDYYYQNQRGWYHSEMTTEEYVRWCDLQLKKESSLACCFLHRSSYNIVRHRVLDVLIVREMQNLNSSVCLWLKSGNDPSKREILKILDKCASNGPERIKSWLTEMIQLSTSQELKSCMAIERNNSKDAEELAVILCASRTVFNYFQKLIREVFDGSSVLITAVRDEIYKFIEQYFSAENFLSTERLSILEDLLIRYTEEEIESDGIFELDGEDIRFKVWVATMFEKLPANGQYYFLSRYTTALQLRLFKAFSSGKRSYESEFYREKCMLSALFAHGANFDFISRCTGMIEDAYVISVNLCGKSAAIRPLVLKSFTWQLKANDREVSLPLDFQAYTNNFLASYSSRFPGLKVKLLHKYSVSRVRMKHSDGLSSCLILSVEQLKVALLFNIRRKCSVRWIAAETQLSDDVCTSVLETFGEANIIKYLSASEVELTIPVNVLSHLNLAFDERNYALFSSGGPSPATKREDLNTPTVKGNRMAIEAHIANVLKTNSPLSSADVQEHVMLSLAAFNVSRRHIRDAIDKLIDKGAIRRDEHSMLLTFAT